MIKAYQYALSPFLGHHCRFEPSCSAYMQTAIQHYGVFRGLILGLRRLSKCHPWCAGGYDPVPNDARKKSGIT